MEVMEGKEGMTEDAIEDEKFMTEDVPWGTSTKGSEAEYILRRKLKSVFWREFGKENLKLWHVVMKTYIIEKGIGSMAGMSYPVFCTWMKGRRGDNTTRNIATGAMTGMRNFVEGYERDKESSCVENGEGSS